MQPRWCSFCPRQDWQIAKKPSKSCPYAAVLSSCARDLQYTVSCHSVVIVRRFNGGTEKHITIVLCGLTQLFTFRGD